MFVLAVTDSRPDLQHTNIPVYIINVTRGAGLLLNDMTPEIGPSPHEAPTAFETRPPGLGGARDRLSTLLRFD